MTTTTRTSVGFDIEPRATGLYFRASHNRDAAWHGPYADAEEIAEMLCFYTREHLIEHFQPPDRDDFAPADNHAPSRVRNWT